MGMPNVSSWLDGGLHFWCNIKEVILNSYSFLLGNIWLWLDPLLMTYPLPQSFLGTLGNAFFPSILTCPSSHSQETADHLSVTIVCISRILHKWNNTIGTVFSLVWLLSLSIIILRFIHVVVCITRLFLFITE